MLKFIKHVFIILLSFSRSLACLAKVSDHTKYLSLNNEPSLAIPILIKLNSYHYYPFMVSLDRCKGSTNTVDDLSSRICVPNNRNKCIKNINKTCDCKCKFDGRKCVLHQKWNNQKCWHKSKNSINDCVCKEDYVWNSSTYDCEINRYLEKIADDLEIACNKIIDVINTVLVKLNDKKATCKMDSSYILLTFFKWPYCCQ